MVTAPAFFRLSTEDRGTTGARKPQAHHTAILVTHGVHIQDILITPCMPGLTATLHTQLAVRN